ncbi:MAG: D-Ala-D-Ala carboxypeptidase family metallohydrolase [Rikenellaceae bacterium]
MKYFSFNELCQSDVAKAQNIDNTPTGADKNNMQFLVDKLLDPLREMYGKPINVTSGYRSAALNKAVKGKPSSQHLRGCAADIVCKDNKQLFDLIKTHFEYDQLINEHDYRWIHVSYVGGVNRRQTLKLP